MSADELVELGARMAEENRAWVAARPEVSPDVRLTRVRAELARRHRADRARTARIRWASGVGAAASIAAALYLLFAPRSDSPRGLGATAAGAAVHEGDRLVARSRPVDIAFEGGSRVELGVGADAAVEELGEGSVAVRLRSGSAAVHVVHHEGRTWWFRGGDHAIEVVGTAFTVRFDAVASSLEVDLREGRVRATGPCADASHVYEAPARFVAGCVTRSVASASSNAASVPTAPVLPSAAASARVDVTPWRAARDRGDLRAAFELASEAGLDGAAAGASAVELVDLALGARLAGSRGEAVRLYLVTRERFAGSDPAATSAFHLGRLSFDESGAWADAERWFSIYLAERPSGALAAEALGRSMEAAERQGAADRARGHAAAYLARFPNGPLAERARKVVDAGAPTPEAPRLPP